MKNLYKIFLGLAVALVTTIGCTEVEIEEQTLSIQEKTSAFRVTAGVPSCDTKVDIDGLSVTWNESEEIAIAEVGENGEFETYYTYVIDAETISEDGKYAEFVGANLTAGKSYIAYNCVYNGYVSTWAQCGVTKNFFCIYGYSYFDSSNIDLMMQSNIFEYDGQSLPQLYFEHKSSLLELEIELESGSEYEGEIESITISSGSTVAFLTDLIFNSYGESVYAFYISSGEQGDASNSIEMELTESVEFGAESSVVIKIPVTWNGHVTEAEGDFSFTIYTSDGKESTVTRPMQILEDGIRYTSELVFEEPMGMVDVDRAALIDLYNSTDGDNWIDNTNWCTDAPLSEWYGVSVNSLGRVTLLNLDYNNLAGTIPESIGNLESLTILSLSMNNFTCAIPESIGNLINLTDLGLQCCGLTGDIPTTLKNLTKLTRLMMGYNTLTGSVDFLASLTLLEGLWISQNNLSGELSDELAKHPFWNMIAWEIAAQKTGYGFSYIPDVYLEPSAITTIDGIAINTEAFFSQNKLTCVLSWRTWCSYSTAYLSVLTDLYNEYAKDGFGLISLNDELDISTISNYVLTNNVPGYVCQMFNSDIAWEFSEGTNRIKYMDTSTSPTYAFVDSDGKVLYSESFIYNFNSNYRESYTRAFMEECFGAPSTPLEQYESTDYTKDGEVLTLQTATVGDGIDLVIVGDGFIDSDMTSGGTYETRMSEAMEHFFSEEPYTTYRDRYNVYAVKAVSKNDGVDGISETTFSTTFGEGTAISGDNTKVFEYALKVSSISTTDNLTVLTVVNSSKYAGTCYMYSNDASVSYCPIVSYNDEQFRQIITHECGGHGFAKLLDEYAYEGTITTDAIESFEWQRSIGWGANVDITSDPDSILWTHLLSDSRYEGLVGIYEGALTYLYGAYRPTDVSIMRYNTGGYNPPSREEIYRRIMVLSGDKYDYEEFVAYDAINRSTAAQAVNAAQTRSLYISSFTPLAQPVIIRNSPNVKK